MSQPLAVWPASPRAFGLRLVWLFVFTNLLLIPGWPFIGGLAALASAAVLSLAYMFALDDFTAWRRHRNAVWTLTPQNLIYHNPDEDMEPHSLDLRDIHGLYPRFGTSLVVRLKSGTAVTMAYIGRPRAARDQINAAIAAQQTGGTAT